MSTTERLSDEKLAAFARRLHDEFTDWNDEPLPDDGPTRTYLSVEEAKTAIALVTELQHSRAAEAVAPGGWALVPREPTPEMEMAALKASRSCEELPDGLTPLPRGYDGWSAAFIYRAMLSVSPSPATGVREALQEAMKLAKLTESLCAGRGDDDYVRGVQEKIESALSALVEQP